MVVALARTTSVVKLVTMDIHWLKEITIRTASSTGVQI